VSSKHTRVMGLATLKGDRPDGQAEGETNTSGLNLQPSTPLYVQVDSYGINSVTSSSSSAYMHAVSEALCMVKINIPWKQLFSIPYHRAI